MVESEGKEWEGGGVSNKFPNFYPFFLPNYLKFSIVVSHFSVVLWELKEGEFIGYMVGFLKNHGLKEVLTSPSFKTQNNRKWTYPHFFFQRKVITPTFQYPKNFVAPLIFHSAS